MANVFDELEGARTPTAEPARSVFDEIEEGGNVFDQLERGRSVFDDIEPAQSPTFAPVAAWEELGAEAGTSETQTRATRTGERLLNSVTAGVLNAGAALASMPGALKRVANVGGGLVGSPEYLAWQKQLDEKTDPLRPLFEGADRASLFMREQGRRMSATKLEEDGILDKAMEGDFKGAGRHLGYAAVENLPQLALLALTVRSGNPKAGLKLMGGMAAGQKLQQLDASDPEMGETAKLINAGATGAIEALTERMGSLPILKRVMASPEAKKGLKRGVAAAVGRVLRSMGQEGSEEFASQVGQNLVDIVSGVKGADGADLNISRKNIFGGAGDAFLVGGAIGSGLGMFEAASVGRGQARANGERGRSDRSGGAPGAAPAVARAARGPRPTVILEGVPTQALAVKDLKLSEDVPNFKADADSESGTVRGERLQGKYERLGTAPIVVWERLNGDLEVITGRHRLDLARRSGELSIPSQVVREADGFDRAAAMTFDAEANIRDGNGKVRDYANYFRASGLDEAEATGRGLLARTKGRAGWTLGAAAGDDLWALYSQGRYTKGDGSEVEGRIPEAKALAIAEAAPGDAALQAVGIKYALDESENPSAEEISGFLQALQSQPDNGVQQLDLLGFDWGPVQDSISMGKAAARIMQALGKERAVLKSGARVSDPAFKGVVEKYGLKQGDTDAIDTKLEELAGEMEAWGRWRQDPVKVARVRADAGLAPAAAAAAAPVATAGPTAAVEGAKAAPPAAAAVPGREDVGDGWAIEEAPTADGAQGTLLRLVDPQGQARAVTKEQAAAIREQARIESGKRAPEEVAAVRAELEAVAAALPGARVVVVNSVEELPAEVRAQVEAKRNQAGGRGATVPGVWVDGVTYLVAGQVRRGDAGRVVTHEAVVHGGLRAVLGDRLGEMLAGSVYAKAAQFKARLAAKAKQYGLDLTKLDQHAEAVEELIAEIYESRAADPTLWERLVSAVRDGLRKLGANLEWTEVDVDALVAAAARRARSAGPAKGGTAAGGTRLSSQSAVDLAKAAHEAAGESMHRTGERVARTPGAQGLAIEGRAGSFYKADETSTWVRDAEATATDGDLLAAMRDTKSKLDVPQGADHGAAAGAILFNRLYGQWWQAKQKADAELKAGRLAAAATAQTIADGLKGQLGGLTDELNRIGMHAGRIVQQFRYLKAAMPAAQVDVIRAALAKEGLVMAPAQESRLESIIGRYQVTGRAAIDAAAQYRANPNAANAAARDAALEAHRRAQEENQEALRILPRKPGSTLIAMMQMGVMDTISVGKNTIGNLIFMPVRGAVDVVAAGADWALTRLLTATAAARGAAPAERMYLGNAQDLMRALPSAAREGARGVVAAVARGEANIRPGGEGDASSRPFRPLQAMSELLSGENIPQVMKRNGHTRPSLRALTERLMEGIPGWYTATMQRLMLATDVPFYSLNYQTSLSNIGREQGLKGRHLARFMADPSPETLREADRRARDGVFQGDSVFTRIGQTLTHVGDKLPGPLGGVVNLAARPLMLFVQTPGNIASEALQIFAYPFSVPAGIVTASWGRAKGDKSTYRAGLRMASKGLVGWAMLSGAGALFSLGLTVGRPPDEKRRKQMEATTGTNRLNQTALERVMAAIRRGERDPDALRSVATWQDGDVTVPFAALGFPGLAMSITANGQEKYLKDTSTKNPWRREDAAQYGALVGQTMKATLDLPFLQGIDRFYESVQQRRPWSSFFTEYGATFSSAFLPRAMKGVTEAQSTWLLDSDSGPVGKEAGNKIYRDRVWSVAQDLPLKRDYFGRRIALFPEGVNPWVARFVDALQHKPVRQDPVDRYVAQLYAATGKIVVIPGIPDQGRFFTWPPDSKRRLGVPPRTIALEDQEYERLTKYVGRLRYENVRGLMATRGFQALNLQEQVQYIDKGYDEALNIGRALVLERRDRQRYADLDPYRQIANQGD